MHAAIFIITISFRNQQNSCFWNKPRCCESNFNRTQRKFGKDLDEEKCPRKISRIGKINGKPGKTEFIYRVSQIHRSPFFRLGYSQIHISCDLLLFQADLSHPNTQHYFQFWMPCCNCILFRIWYVFCCRQLFQLLLARDILVRS